MANIRYLFLALIVCFSNDLMCQSLANGLVFYYPFNNNPNDLSGNGLNGINFGAYSPDANGVPNSAIYLDGIDDYFQTPDDSLIDIQYPLTISFMVKFLNSNSVNFLANTDYVQNDYTGVWFNILASNNAIAMGYGDNSIGTTAANRRSVSGSIPLYVNTWHHVVGVIKGPTNMEIYVDGVKDNNIAYGGYGGPTIDYSSNVGTFGKLDVSNQSPYHFQGYFDEYGMWNRALSLSEIQYLAQNNGKIQGKNVAFSTSTSGLNVSFQNLSLSFCQDTSESYLWTFGDGDTSILKSPNHLYSRNGRYQVCLTLTDTCGSLTHCDSVSICQAPISFFTQIIDSTSGRVSFFSLKDSINTGYTWDFGDGSGSILPDPVHVYSSSGTYQACLITHTNGCGSVQYCRVVDLSILSLEENSMDFKIANNDGVISITSQELIGDYFEVSTIDGKIISAGDIQDPNRLEINLTEFRSGLVILRIKRGQVWKSFKVIR
ncbi:MAG: PKD domain-containing protein [Bacteroidota bacterium]|nr:PKD domain-containing protein [Bacteroidota bacterium]MDX5448796.1 PKD domain-containing protein [Bacteroidota bacterium]